jgi:hypothetical protein
MKDQKVQPGKDPKAMKDQKEKDKEKDKIKAVPTAGKPASPGSHKR